MERWGAIAGLLGALVALTWAVWKLMPSSRDVDTGREHEDALSRYDGSRKKSNGSWSSDTSASEDDE
jgi:hypothetical protein